MDYVLSTIVIHYYEADSEEQKKQTTYTKVEDIYPSLPVTTNLIRNLQSTERYKILFIDYQLKSVPFKKINKNIVNTYH